MASQGSSPDPRRARGAGDESAHTPSARSMAAGKALSQADIAHFEAQLRRTHATLSEDVEQLEAEVEATATAERVTRGDDATMEADEDMDRQLIGHEGTLLREVDEALARIEAGAFGRCADCGAWIARERLEALPHSRLCLACERESERG